MASKASASNPRPAASTASAPLATSTERVVYTALMGDYEDLQEQPTARDTDVRFVCFTDNPGLTSETWDVQVVEPVFPLDSVRSARSIKVRGHAQIDGYAETLWIDNRVTLIRPAHELLNDALADADLACFDHSFRERLVDEFEAVIAQGRDDHVRISEQLFHYAELTPELLDAKPLWTGIVARRRSDHVDRAMTLWFDHLLRYSRRDQLSVLAALGGTDLPVKRYALDNWESEWHEWARPSSSTVNRRKPAGGATFDHTVRLPLAQMRSLESQVETLSAELDASTAQVKDLKSQLKRVKSSRAYRASSVLGKIRGK